MRIVSSAAAKAAQAPPSLLCDPILRQTSCPLRARESVGSAQGAAVRGRCRRSRCGIPGETDLQEDARLAVYKLGEDANGELSPEPTRRGDLQVTAGLSSRMVARLLRFQGACIGSCGRTGDQSKTGRACMYFDSQFWPAWVCTHRRSKPTRRGDLHDCVRTWSLVCLDFKARASGARVCSAGSADYISGRLFALLH